MTFGSYEIYKKSLLNRFPNVKPAFIYALAAIMGDVTGSGWLCPSEVMKQQLQAGIYPSMSEAIKGIYKKSGFGGFYQGFTGGLARYVFFIEMVVFFCCYHFGFLLISKLWKNIGQHYCIHNSDVPFRVAQLTTFEVTKNLYLRAKKAQSSNIDPDSISLSALEAAICGAAAGSFSAAITNPLDRIKTLMMTDTTNAYGGSFMSCASKIVKDEGVQGFFTGVAPRVGYIAPSVCIFFVTYEFVQQRMNKKSSDWEFLLGWALGGG